MNNNTQKSILSHEFCQVQRAHCMLVLGWNVPLRRSVVIAKQDILPAWLCQETAVILMSCTGLNKSYTEVPGFHFTTQTPNISLLF